MNVTIVSFRETCGKKKEKKDKQTTSDNKIMHISNTNKLFLIILEANISIALEIFTDLTIKFNFCIYTVYIYLKIGICFYVFV